MRFKYLVLLGTCTLFYVITLRGISPLGAHLSIMVLKKKNQDACWGRESKAERSSMSPIVPEKDGSGSDFSESPKKT